MLLGQVARGVLLLWIATASRRLVGASRSHCRELHQAHLGGEALVLGEVVVFRNRLLRLVELVVELADVLRLSEVALGPPSVGELCRTLVSRPRLQAR